MGIALLKDYVTSVIRGAIEFRLMRISSQGKAATTRSRRGQSAAAAAAAAMQQHAEQKEGSASTSASLLIELDDVQCALSMGESCSQARHLALKLQRSQAAHRYSLEAELRFNDLPPTHPSSLLYHAFNSVKSSRGRGGKGRERREGRREEGK